jgi:DNA-binding response OmpR family regulator
VAYILILDDDRETRELLEILLSEEGHEVGTAASASTALDLINTRDPDLIFLDLRLAGHSGEHFIQAYRAPPNARAPLVLLSAAADLEQVAARSGVRYLAKPYDLDELLQTVAKLLGAR